MNLFLDDERTPPSVSPYGGPIVWDYVVRTVDEAIKLIKTGKITFISLDHDLGDVTEKDGYDVACFIEMGAYNGTLPRIRWALHSQNVVGRKEMYAALTNADKYWSQWEEKNKDKDKKE